MFTKLAQLKAIRQRKADRRAKLAAHRALGESRSSTTVGQPITRQRLRRYV